MITTERVEEDREDMVVMEKGEVRGDTAVAEKAVGRVATGDRVEEDMGDRAEDTGVKVRAAALRQLLDYSCQE
jgi:hypothetical protein